MRLAAAERVQELPCKLWGVPLPRLQLFELEDLPWFPRTIRDFSTDYLRFVETLLRLHEPVAPLLQAKLKEAKTARCVDLCSGGGGPILAFHEALRSAGSDVKITLTDKYPNLVAFAHLTSSHTGNISYVAEPVDATSVPDELTGMRTMFNAFHHFPPAEARSILRSAVRAWQPIGIVEISERTPAMMLLVMFTPLFVWVVTPFLQPFRWRRLFWTYGLPAIPLMCWWDGMVSQWRCYRVAELLALTEGMEEFGWDAGRLPLRWGLGHATYLVGSPARR